MLTTGEGITAALKFYANSGSESIATDTDAREKSLFFFNQVCKKAWTLAPWWWRHGNGTVASVTTVGTMPADFSHMGVHGQVYISGQTRSPLIFVEPGEFHAARATDTSTTTYPTHYTLSGKTALGLAQIQVWPQAATAVTLNIQQYVKKLPSLVDRPGKLTIGASLQDGSLTGTYTYKVTFVTADGETEAGPASAASAAVTSRKLPLTGIPVSTSRAVTSRKLYRTTGSGSSYLLLATIADNTTTTYTDNTADGSLGAAEPAITAAVSGLEVFPDDMVEPLLIQWLIAKHMEAVGDLRAQKEIESCEKDVKRYWAEYKQGQNAEQRLPSFGAFPYTAMSRSLRDRFVN